ncbi:10397_t:CDS:1 [Paraglomus brasilianum]|uniref:10397_t:CDS:1 n=1 Tax=Paraglomus brasilianum TaxID=144538 RepID=A0A9N9BNB3_9GLOM|nr:10397_t:CDS:1 [Paraglomus brasilianum]
MTHTDHDNLMENGHYQQQHQLQQQNPLQQPQAPVTFEDSLLNILYDNVFFSSREESAYSPQYSLASFDTQESLFGHSHANYIQINGDNLYEKTGKLLSNALSSRADAENNWKYSSAFSDDTRHMGFVRALLTHNIKGDFRLHPYGDDIDSSDTSSHDADIFPSADTVEQDAASQLPDFSDEHDDTDDVISRERDITNNAVGKDKTDNNVIKENERKSRYGRRRRSRVKRLQNARNPQSKEPK